MVTSLEARCTRSEVQSHKYFRKKQVKRHIKEMHGQKPQHGKNQGKNGSQHEAANLAAPLLLGCNVRNNHKRMPVQRLDDVIAGSDALVQ